MIYVYLNFSSHYIALFFSWLIFTCLFLLFQEVFFMCLAIFNCLFMFQVDRLKSWVSFLMDLAAMKRELIKHHCRGISLCLFGITPNVNTPRYFLLDWSESWEKIYLIISQESYRCHYSRAKWQEVSALSMLMITLSPCFQNGSSTSLWTCVICKPSVFLSLENKPFLFLRWEF